MNRILTIKKNSDYFVSVLDVRTAIPVIMGANIGTSMTNALVSAAHSNNRAEFRRAFAGATGHATWIVTYPADRDRDSVKKTTDGHATRAATHPADTFQEPGQGIQESGLSRKEVVGVHGTSNIRKPSRKLSRKPSSFLSPL